MEFKHPKYYKELRKRNKSDQAISHSASTEANSRRAPGPGLSGKQQAASDERQAASKGKRQANEELEGLKRYVKNKKNPI